MNTFRPASDGADPRVRWWGYGLLVGGWLSLVALLTPWVLDGPVLTLVPVALLIGLPLFLSMAYSISILRSRNVLVFSRQGWLHWLHSGRLLRYLAWFALSVAFGCLAAVYIAVAGWQDWLLLLLCACLMPLAVTGLHRLYRAEVRPFAAREYALRVARWAVAGVAACTQLLLLYLVPPEFEGGTLAEAIEQQRQRYTVGPGASVLVYEAVNLMALWQGLKSFAAQEIGAWLALLWGTSVGFFFYLNLGLSAFLIPATEYRRLLLPLSDAEQVPPLSPLGIALAAGLLVLAVLVVGPGPLYLNESLRARGVEPTRQPTPGDRLIQQVEMIGERYYSPGTIARVQELNLSTASALGQLQDGLCPALDEGFVAMAENVEHYLDWYYSLGGEYSRLLALGTGSLQTLMLEQLQESLMRDAPFGELQQRLTVAMQRRQETGEEHRRQLELLLRERELTPADGPMQVVASSDLRSLAQLSDDTAVLDTGQRFLISGSLAVATAISAKVVGKVAAKGVIKAGAKAVAKAGAGKAAGALGGAATGAATGAAVGSVIPGFGTAVGAAVGGAVGALVIGLTVEQGLLKLEEVYARDEQRAQILAAVQEQRDSLRLSMGCADPAADRIDRGEH